MALGLLWHAGIDWKAGPTGPGRREREMLLAQLENRINVPQTSSMGRLFDAVSSLVGIRQQSHYEGQAAIELEALADRSDEIIYPIPLTPERTLDPTPMIRQILADLHAGVPASKISGRFHNSIATMVDSVCRKIGDEHEIKVVALSGGVWQNITLLRQTVKQLEQAGFEVLIHEQVPPNDGGLALGQAMVAHFRLAVDKTDHPIAVGADEFH